MALPSPLFHSFFLGGFECSTHRLRNGKRLDLLAATRHDVFARQDYERLQAQGIRSVRDGLRWHLIERHAGLYDFSSAIPMLRAARDTHMHVIWDLWHYGWPDDLDIFSGAFVDRFAAFCAEAVKHISQYGEPWVAAINEISFFSWAGGESGIFNPFSVRRGTEMKRQLVRASVAAVHAMRTVNPAVRVCQIDPMINVVPRSHRSDDVHAAEAYRQSQFEAFDMLLGRREPQLGGHETLFDAIGVNYYIHNQFVWNDGLIVPSDPRYRHVSDMLEEIYERYRLPLFIAETGIEDESRPAWLRYMSREVYAALSRGVPVEGICLYPIVNHPGWDDDRHCYNGLFDYADGTGSRELDRPLANELARQQRNLDELRSGRVTVDDLPGLDTSALDWAAHVMQERTDEGRSG